MVRSGPLGCCAAYHQMAARSWSLGRALAPCPVFSWLGAIASRWGKTTPRRWKCSRHWTWRSSLEIWTAPTGWRRSRGGIFDYSDKGQLDRTHVRFFTKRSIEKMLLDCGWAPRVWEANRVPVECSEFAGYWSALSGDQRQALLAGWQDFDVYQWMVVVTPSVDAPTWELKEARGMAESLRDELQALTVLHQRERASLLEHQKAFAEAKDLIGKLQQEINELRTEVGSLRAEKTLVESELATTQIALQARTAELNDRAWRSRWRRLMGSHHSR